MFYTASTLFTALTLTLTLTLALPSSAGGLSNPIYNTTKNLTIADAAWQPVSAPATLKCETTAGSPTIPDIRGVVENLRAMDSEYWCSQDNRFGSKCTKQARFGGANVSVCGRFGYYIRCNDVADATERLAKACEWRGRAGGWLRFDGGTGYMALH